MQNAATTNAATIHTTTTGNPAGVGTAPRAARRGDSDRDSDSDSDNDRNRNNGGGSSTPSRICTVVQLREPYRPLDRLCRKIYFLFMIIYLLLIIY